MTKTHYATLGIAETATEDEVKHAFRERALAHHPDHNPADAKAADRFKDVVAAYEVLGDHAKRAEYDGWLEAVREAERAKILAAAAAAWRTRAPSPAPPSADIGDALAMGAMAVILLKAVFGGTSARWDRNVGRYRDPGGRFTSG